MFQKKFFTVLLVAFLLLQGVAFGQRIQILEKKYDLADEVRIFTDKGDIAPPYNISSEVKHYGERAYTFVYINGQQVLPHSSRRLPGLTDQKPLSAFAQHKLQAGEIYFDMKREGRSYDQIASAIAEHFRNQPEISEVEQDGLHLNLKFQSGECLEYWVSPGMSSYEDGAQTMADYLKRKLDSNYSLVFSSEVPLAVHPRDHEELKNEINMARSMAKSEVSTRHWDVLDIKTAQALAAGEEGM